MQYDIAEQFVNNSASISALPPFVAVTMPKTLANWLPQWRQKIHERHRGQWGSPLPPRAAEEMLEKGLGRLVVGIWNNGDNTCSVVPVVFYRLARTEQIHPFGYMGLAGVPNSPSALYPEEVIVVSK